ncbi:MAG: histidine kinase [Ferruginibacter sp.]
MISCLSILCCFYTPSSLAQNDHRNSNILFYQLNTANGLTDNYINCMVVDKSGNLWVGTGEGLNLFNGKTVVKFFNQDYPQLQNDNIHQLLCDSKNRVWVSTSYGDVTVIDEQRKFHRLGLYKDKKFVPVRYILQTDEQDIILLTPDNHYTLKQGINLIGKDSLTFDNLSVLPVVGFDSLYKKGFRQALVFDKASYFFATTTGLCKVNYSKHTFEKEYPITGCTLLTKWGDNALLLFDPKSSQLKAFDLATGSISFPFSDLKDQHGETPSAVFTRATRINATDILFTTKKGGCYIYNVVSRQLFNYKHNAADPTTIINNSPLVIATGSDGWIFLGATPNGVSYFNSKAVIGQQVIFQDRSGNSYDGYINNLTTQDNDKYYISASDNLIEWTRSTGQTEFVNYGSVDGSSLQNKEEITSVEFDNRGQLWLSTVHYGIFILDKNKRQVGHLLNDSGKFNTIPLKAATSLQMGADGHMWMTSGSGVCRMDPSTFAVERFNDTLLGKLNNEYCYRTWFSDKENVWIATAQKGLWKYDLFSKQLKIYNEQNGLLSNSALSMNKDRFNNIYAGTAKGLTVFFTNGTYRTFSVKDGLLNKRIEALLLDKQNRMWIGNDVGLACFNIADTSIKAFDERYGLSIQGFRINSYHQNSDDELVWGTEKGLQYFYPDDLLKQKIQLNTTINRVETRSIFSDLTKTDTFNLASSDNYVTFYFTSIDYSTHLRTFYEYQLESLDKDWIRVADQNFVRYSSLPPGKYTFKLRASNDGKVWEDSENSVTISIAKPLWQQLWFKISGLILALLLVWFVISYYRKKQVEQREELETEAVINYFASQINSRQKTEDILWDVVRNCISKLNFVDCVIYLVDTDRGVLVQKAAYGAKNKNAFHIHQPLDIPLGKGIVGTVAQTGKAEIISNTETDQRYIIDDEKRHSEIAVPLIIDGKVIGVIDSEHHKRNYFTQKHLSILSTIAVLCANQIERAMAEEEKQKAKMEVLVNKQKVAESRLQSLRLQMNPHFLFNALNSIQQMILANEEMIATRYLSRFSKLLRSILVHSDKEMISLREEIEILNLYVELESVRFRDKFSYRIICDNNVEADEISIPTLLVQPFVENAIWHGLMHKEGSKELLLEFTEKDNFVKCIVQDNGIGRNKANELKISTGQGSKHKSKGIEVSVERLMNMRNAMGQAGEINIVDLKDPEGNAIGTRVELYFPV